MLDRYAVQKLLQAGVKGPQVAQEMGTSAGYRDLRV
jgi:hypothetical protein